MDQVIQNGLSLYVNLLFYLQEKGIIEKLYSYFGFKRINKTEDLYIGLFNMNIIKNKGFEHTDLEGYNYY